MAAVPSLKVTEAGRGMLVRITGEMDHVSGPALWERLTEVLAGHAAFIVLDLSAVSFCDSAGLNLLLRADRHAATNGTDLGLARVPHMLSRILAMTGTDQVLHVYGTVADAETDLRSRSRTAEDRA